LPLLAVPSPYDFELSTERFRAYGPDRANLWRDGGLHRVVAGREVRIAAVPGGVSVEPLDEATEPAVRRLLGLPFDLAGFEAFAAGHEVLAPLVSRLRGLRPPLAPDPFEALVTAITAQQVSLFAAFAVRNRLIERFGDPGVHAVSFPAAERIAAAGEDELAALGLSWRKAEYVLGLARSELDYAELAALPDEEVKARLVAVRGLGEWTADWFLARHLARPRAWPAGDLGLRKAAERFCAGGRTLATGEVRALGARFAPFENLAAHYLLAHLGRAEVERRHTARDRADRDRERQGRRPDGSLEPSNE
jgi:DNA-3-methyladenine glycosylase II